MTTCQKLMINRDTTMPKFDKEGLEMLTDRV